MAKTTWAIVRYTETNRDDKTVIIRGVWNSYEPESDYELERFAIAASILNRGRGYIFEVVEFQGLD